MIFHRKPKADKARPWTMFDKAPVGLGVVKDRIITYANEFLCKLLGRTPDELVGQSAAILYADKAEFDRVGMVEYAKLLSEGKVRADVRFIDKSGRAIDVLIRLALINQTDPSEGVILSVVDIGAQKTIERELKLNVAFLDALFQATPLAVAVLDSDYVIVRVNRQFQTLFGFTEAEAVGQPVHDLVVPPQLRQQAVADGTKASLGEPVRFESVRRRKDGSLFDALIIGRQILLDNEEVGVYVIYQDVTARNRRGEELKRSEDRFKSLYNNSPLPFQSLDDRAEVMEVNQTWLDIMGYAREEVVGRPFEEFIDPASRDHFKAYFRGLKSEGEILGREFKFIRKSGDRILVSFHCKIVPARDDRTERILSVFQDITEHRKIEKENRRLEAQLQQAQRMEALGALAGGVAHDFNNILAAVMGYTELAMEDAARGTLKPEQLEPILKSAARARDLIKQILTFSRKAEVNVKPINLNGEIRQAVSLLEQTIPKMIEIRLDLEPDLPAVKADRTQMEQLIMNLGTNARDAMPEGGRLSIRTGSRMIENGRCQACGESFRGRYVRLDVTDTGQGMTPEVIERIFEPFFTTKDVGQGTGLGLSTVYGIVSAHRGHILCSSVPGQGTVFSVFLPVSGEREASHPVRTESTTDPGQGEAVILVVDDEHDLRELSQRQLSRAGYRVMTAASGEEALRIYRQSGREIDLVLLDLSMPGIGGHKCLEGLLTLNPRARVIICTGYSLDGDITDRLRSQAAAVAYKPLSRAELLSAVGATLQDRDD